MRVFSLDSEQWIGRPLREVFPFFADPRNLEAITPPWLRFELKTGDNLVMHGGLKIDYGLRLHGIPFSWQSEITVWDPPRRFVDEQVRGPYLLWRHDHTFEEQQGRTLVRDHVEYAVPGGRLAQKLVVGRELDKIFEFRRRTLEKILR